MKVQLKQYNNQLIEEISPPGYKGPDGQGNIKP